MSQKDFTLRAADGTFYKSTTPGKLGGNKCEKIYGELTCSSAIRHLPGYAAVRVFFADEATAIAAGFRPCGNCMKDKYKVWKAGRTPGTAAYPWLVVPKESNSKDR